MRIHSLILCAAALTLAACGESNGPKPTTAARAAIARFNYLADSLTNAGKPEDAQIFTGAAEAVRVAGDVGTIPISIDGTSTEFAALTLQLTLPGGTFCDELGCEESPAVEEQFLLAWQEDPMGRVLFIAKDGFGTKSVEFDTTTTDTLTAPPEGVALLGDESGDSWFSIGGTATNQGLNVVGVCAKPSQEPMGVAYSCFRATYRWNADFTAGDLVGAEHHIVIPSTVVAGAKLAITGFTGEIEARIGQAPIRSRLVARRDRARAGR